MAQGVALNDALIDGFHLSFVVAGACVAVGLVAAQLLLRPAPVAARRGEPVVALESGTWRSEDAA
jgi:hypothetical protein